ncbi:nuclear transport factor 2 family protein [Novosphingobium sp. PS1R-30]|uniref:Nuclear transport factor 2 family protein n=1 Tax=Novosphingobium anseongense TaxID=3133436 RepID=A0ABU8RT08_9SPHN|nr:MAG: nuclear transport factor 2 family protein [Novosphingobium sp.]
MTRDELETFNADWLQAWTEKDIPRIAALYAEDCLYQDNAMPAGLNGRAALLGYIGKLFPAVPDWTYTPDELWPVDGGFCARWFLDMGGKRFRGFELVKLRGREIVLNEVYTHEI